MAPSQPPAPSSASAAGDPDTDAYDVVVVGSGFGGSVSALRLTEKGYRVAVLEAGRRFTPDTLPSTSWDIRNYLWAPALGLYGIQRIHLLRNVLVLAGAGVGGGSLNYANTLYEPMDPFYQDPQWAHITDWKDELAPYYGQARRMLGVRLNPTVTPADEHLRNAAERMGVGETFHLAPVGVFFGDGKDADGEATAEPGGEVADPYFGGVGPRRRACVECGSCMTGCRYGAKNTLNENYLYLAERAGAEVFPMTTVTDLTEHPDGGYEVRTVATDRPKAAPRRWRAGQVVLAAGAYGTQSLLHALRDAGRLPGLSPRLGELTRTNSEALVGAQTSDRRYRRKGGKDRADFTRGVAITSSIHPNDTTHIEPVRYGKGSNSMGFMSTIQVPGGGRGPRWLRFLALAASHPTVFARSMSKRRWSERTIIALVMQTHDNSLTTFRKPKGLGKGKLTSRQGHGRPNPNWIPEGQRTAELIAEDIGGFAGGTVGDVFNIPMTAHFLGGCPIGVDAEHGVIDAYHRLHGHPGIHVVDGSAVSANLGVNPSLTITAQAERAMALWPNHGETDQRPAPHQDYRRLEPVAPKNPVVPDGAYAALRFVRERPSAAEPAEPEAGAAG